MIGDQLLLNSLLLSVPADQRVEDRQDVAPVFDEPEENIPQLRFALGLAVPFGQDRGRNFNVAPELFRRVAPQKETVEKCRLALRKVEVVGHFDGNELCARGHKEKCSLPKSGSASSGTRVFVLPARQCPFWYHSILSTAVGTMHTTPGLLPDSNRRRML
jgi:hypothetical protein